MSDYREIYWYRFGLQVGLSNLWVNGLKLGVKKTLGKIFQPINAYSRFPEYDRYERVIQQFLKERRGSSTVRILDVGSPKLFGFYLAYHYPVEIYLTDISTLNIDEYMVMWNTLKGRAKGKVIFQEQDARALGYEDAYFDIVYSMSVIEHIEGADQDTAALREYLRVLKAKGLLLISFPFGPQYLEQLIIGFAYTLAGAQTSDPLFFQRIYNREVVEERIIPAIAQHATFQIWTIWRARIPFLRCYHLLRQKLGQNVNGLLGFINPFISMLINSDQPGMDRSFFTNYDVIYSDCDIYADLIFVAHKSAS